MTFSDQQVREMLEQGAYVSREELATLAEGAKQKRVPLLEYLISRQVITPDLFGQAVAEHHGVPYADLNSRKPNKRQVFQIPEGLAKKERAVLFDYNETKAVIATDKFPRRGVPTTLKKAFPKHEVMLAYSLSEDIDAILRFYEKNLSTRFTKIIQAKGRVAPELVDEIIKEAYQNKTSDIHFEPQKDTVLIRFRIDGVLQHVGEMPKENYENILNRIKVQSRLRIDEHFAAQDGSMRFSSEQGDIDLRTSIVPTIDGEKVVLRLLAAYVQSWSLQDIGVSLRDQKILNEAAKKPFGMILVTGPTGSGKTTTLYSVLRILNEPDTNITTIEDPVEYKLTGANQIQVNTDTDLTFAKGLRSIVRQDPDIILVGEIRDNETAEIAVNAALTGHLLLSTFHANDAATAIPRLLDMSIEPFLLASTLELVMAQRLVRKICDSCRHSYTESVKTLAKDRPYLSAYFEKDNVVLYKGKGCSACNDTGYKGQIGVFELIPITPKLEETILDNPSAQDIWKVAEKEGARAMFSDGMAKVTRGDTTLEELVRVVGVPLQENHGQK